MSKYANLFYVAPKQSMELILKQGIFLPKQVNEMVEKGELSRDVLGISYGMDTSNFPDYVSLLTDEHSLKWVGEALCYSRLGTYTHPDFMAIGYSIDERIMNDERFIDVEEVKKMHHDPYPGEVLFKGAISPEYIVRYFAVRAWRL